MAQDDIEQKIKLEFETNAKETQKSVDNLDKSINEVDKSTEKVGETSKKTSNNVSKGFLESAKSFKIMGVSINSVSKSLKLLKVSLVATGIGAIVVVVGALAAAFLSTQKGVDKLNSVLEPLGEVLQTIWGIAQKLGEGLFQMVSGDVRGGWEAMGDAVENVGEQMDEAWKRGVKLHELQIQIRQDAINDGLVTSRLNRLKSEQLEIAEDITKTEKERKAAYISAIAAQEAIVKLQTRENENQIKLARERQKANDTDDEAKRELNDLIAKGEDIEASGIRAKTLLLKKLNAVKAETVGDGKERNVLGQTFEEFEKENELIKKKIEQENAEAERVRNERAQANEELKEYLDEEEQIRIDAEDERLRKLEENAKQELAIEKAKAEQKRVIEAETKQLIDSGLQALKGAFAENKTIQKGILIAENALALSRLTMNTIEAVSKDNAASPLTLGMPWSGIHLAQGAIGATNIISSTAQGLKALGGGDAGSVPNMGSSGSGGGASATPQVDFQTSSENQIATTIASNTNEQPPVQAFVVESEVTTAQALARKKINSNSF